MYVSGNPLRSIPETTVKEALEKMVKLIKRKESFFEK